jgi:RimJ/RimL family protein N-acetyltransferase
MKKLLIGHDFSVAEWVRRRIPHMRKGSFGAPLPNGTLPYGAIGVTDGKDDWNLLGGVVFHGFLPNYRSIQWSAASDSTHWLSRSLITDIMKYPFLVQGCVRVTAYIPRRNERARKFHTTFGFKQEGLIRRGFGDDDCFVYGLLASEWRKSRFNLDRQTNNQSVEAA